MLNPDPIKYTRSQKKYIKRLGSPKYEDWSSNKKINKEIKDTISKQLLKYQNNCCAYCELRLYETSRPEIEHIAPRKNHPEFEYINKNLVMACQYCNSSSKKGKEDTIKIKKQYYSSCEFNIVHPYYDKVEDYFEEDAFIIKIKSGLIGSAREKAERTIELFDLSNSVIAEAKAKQKVYDYLRKKNTLSDLFEKLADKACSYQMLI